MLNLQEKAFFEQSRIPLVLFEPAGRDQFKIILASEGLCRQTQSKAEEWIGRDELALFNLFMSNDPEAVFNEFKSFLRGQGGLNLILGYPFPGTDRVSVMHATGIMQTLADGSVVPLVVCQSGGEKLVTAQEVHEAYVRYQEKTIDPLTGLITRSYMRFKAMESVRAIWDNGSRPVLYYFNIRSLHLYNTKFGFEQGDELIKLLADSVCKVFPDAKVGRGTEDHIIVLEKFESREDCAAKVQKVQDLFIHGAYGFTYGIQAGITIFRHQEIRPSTALDNARTALKMIDSDSNELYRFYDEDTEQKILRNHEILNDFESAMTEGRIQVYYHAILRTDSKKLTVLEALARWIDPQGIMIFPGEFIEVLADNRLLYKLDLYMIEQVCKEFKIREDAGLPLVPVSVNLSARDFEQTDMPEAIAKLLKKYDLSPDNIIIEITEQELAQSAELFESQLARLHEAGHKLWIDDFGSGYSAIHLFHHFNVDLVKFDMNLVRHLDDNGGINRVILRSMAEMFRKLGIHSLAEGVETEDQFEFIRSIGSELVQGFLFFRPISLEQSVQEFREKGPYIPHELPTEREIAHLRAMRNINPVYSDTVARVLASDYVFLYLINLTNNSYSQFSIWESIREMGFPESGEDYLTSLRTEFLKIVPPEDAKLIRKKLSKDNLVSRLSGEDQYGFTFRANIKGKEKYLYASFRLLEEDHDRMIIFGVRDINDEVRERQQMTTQRQKTQIYFNLARALSTDYAFLYDVDLNTGNFTEYHSAVGKETLFVKRKGKNFFTSARDDALTQVDPEYQDLFLAAFTEENILNILDQNNSFSLNYRLLLDGKPTFMHMKISRMNESKGGHHIIVGVSNVDEQMRAQEELERATQEKITYSRISALSGSYIAIYTVDPETDQYLEYSSDKKFDRLGIQKSGKDFFLQSRLNAKGALYPDDMEEFNLFFTKENVLRSIHENGLFTMDYRLIIEDKPHYVRLKAAQVHEKNGTKIIVGIQDIDARIRKDQENEALISKALEQAISDQLTGLKNKYAYVNAEARLNSLIDNNKPVDFMIAVFDLNGLKTVNDTRGHQAGDQLIRSASELLTELFSKDMIY
ncbi:MAG: EAL domain-containing protein, partial [Clostridia bacterium]|nr:EAL domain-containing protein [Clostridia bacterium]